jgi:hypothetical protein
MEISIRKYLVALTLVLVLVQVSSVHSIKMPETLYIKNLSSHPVRVGLVAGGEECTRIFLQPRGLDMMTTIFGCRNADRLSFKVGRGPGAFYGALNVSKIEYKGPIDEALVKIVDVSIPSHIEKDGTPSHTAKREVFVHFSPIGRFIGSADLEPARRATR